jgi:hypothetical protein
MLTFIGEGYTPQFITNFSALVARIGAGEPIELIDGPDDVCAPLADSDDTHCDDASVRRRDRDALRALAGAAHPLPAARPLVLDRAAIVALRAQFAAGEIRAACSGCSWSSLCTDIASGGFAAARL